MTAIPPRPRPRHAFTLIELMIAIALGMAIILTAMSGFRVASQCVTVVNRMSLENSLMRAGVSQALDEADHWWLYDNPADPTQQPLRGSSGVRGLPFTPFAGRFALATSDGDPEKDTGFDPNYQWPASDSRGWFHADTQECVYATDRRFGHYEIFAHLKPSPNLSNAFGTGVAFGTASPRHLWLFNQLEGLKNNLGYYGAMEYMPANTIYAVLGNGATDEMLSEEWTKPTPPGTAFHVGNMDGNGTQTPRGLYNLTKDNSVAVIPGSPYTYDNTHHKYGSQFSPDDLAQRNFMTYNVNQYANVNDLKNYLAMAMIVQPQLPSHPEHWPSLSVAVSRYISYSRIASVCKVRWTSPLTGQTVELSFSTLCTTLRGARQQRKLDS